MQDGGISAAERRDIRRQAQDAIAALQALCADLLDDSTANVARLGRKGE